jgi:hypothetical protein
MSVFRVVKAATLIRITNQNYQDSRSSTMRLSWSDHLTTARTLELSGDPERGTALALMGIALLLLSQDLLAQELAATNDRMR